MKQSRADFEKAVNDICEHFDFTFIEIGKDISELIYADELPMCRLIYLESAQRIGVSFYAETIKTDAIKILQACQNAVDHILILADYYVRGEETFTDQEAYQQMYADIANNFQQEITEDEYKPTVPITYQTLYPLYEAHHPFAKEESENLKHKMKYYKKF